jgi:hypothetical protein
MDSSIKVRMEMMRDDLEYTQGAEGLTIESVSSLETSTPRGLDEARFIDSVVVVVTATVAVLAKHIVYYFLRSKEQGLQIDLRTIPATISVLANVPQGFLVIIDKAGKPMLHKAEYVKGEDLTPILSHLLQQG